MTAACCRDRCGFKHLLADGAFLMLSAFCGFGSCRVNDPLAGAVSRYIGLVAALALMPVIGVVILPICAIAVGMCCGDRCGFKNLLADGAFLMLSAVSGFGSCRVNDPLAGAVSRNIGLVAALTLVPVVGAVILPLCAVAVGMAGRRILIGGLNIHIITGHGEGGGGAGLVSQRYAACLNDPLNEVCSGRSLRRNGDLNALHGVGDRCACGNGCRAAGDGNGVIPQGGDLGVLAALIAADGTLLMLQAGLGRGGRLVYLPHEGVGRQILCAAARIRAGAVGALMPMALCVRIPRTAVGMGMGTHIRLHGDGLVGLDITAAAAIVILDRYRCPSQSKLVTIEDHVLVSGEVSRGVVGIMRGDHHARRVKILADHVLGLGRRCCDLDALHRLDDLQHLKLVEYPHIAARLSRWILKDACLFPVYGHLILCKPGAGILRFCVNKDFYRILRICLNRGVRCQIIPAAACIALLNGNLMDINAHLIC